MPGILPGNPWRRLGLGGWGLSESSLPLQKHAFAIPNVGFRVTLHGRVFSKWGFGEHVFHELLFLGDFGVALWACKSTVRLERSPDPSRESSTVVS